MNVIAKKSTFMIGIRIFTILIITVYLLYESSSLIFLIFKYIFIAYAIYQLILLFIQLYQPKELIKLENQTIYIYKIFKTLEINIKSINDINYKLSNNRGTTHNFGTIYISTVNGDKIKVINVEKLEDTARNFNKLIYKKD